MKVKDNAKIYKVKENGLMNLYDTKQNQPEKADNRTNGKGYRAKDIACINSFISYFMNQEKNN